MPSTYTTNKNIEKPANNSYIGTWNVPINSDWDVVDTAFGGTYNVSLSNANVTLTLTRMITIAFLYHTVSNLMLNSNLFTEFSLLFTF